MDEKLNELLFFPKTDLSKSQIICFKVFRVILCLFFIYLIFKGNKNNDIPSWYEIKQDLKLLINKYKYLINSDKIIEENSPIWMMWYQGIENAPPIVLSCIQSVIDNRGKHPIFLISKYNLKKYIKLPQYIIEKFNNNTFSITHLSDIVRFGLLEKYGGYWIDATYLVTTPLEKVNTTFYTLKLKECFTNTHPFINCKWCGNFIATSKNSFFATYGYQAFLKYWNKYNSLIDYYLIDYFISILYNKVRKFKEKIDKLPLVECNIFSLVNIFNNEYNGKNILCLFNKLMIKGNLVTSINAKSTYYGYILEKYKFNAKDANESLILI